MSRVKTDAHQCLLLAQNRRSVICYVDSSFLPILRYILSVIPYYDFQFKGNYNRFRKINEALSFLTLLLILNSLCIHTTMGTWRTYLWRASRGVFQGALSSGPGKKGVYTSRASNKMEKRLSACTRCNFL